MTYSIEQMAQLAKKFDKMGWGAERVTMLGQANLRKYRAIEEILDGKSLAEAIATAAAMQVAVPTTNTSHADFESEVNLPATSGGATIANSKSIFTGHFDSDIVSWGTDKLGSDTTESTAHIYKQSKNGKYTELFGSINPDIARLCFQQGQIVAFAQHLKSLGTDTPWYHLPFMVDGKVFVACVYVYDGELEVDVYHFASDYVWGAGYGSRLVVRQQVA